jgi:conjugal transfer pilus assembly protein TraF
MLFFRRLLTLGFVKTRFLTCLCFMYVLTLSTSLAERPFYSQRDKGWMFYEKEIPAKPVERLPRSKDLPDASKIRTAREKIKALEKEFEEATSAALLSPTFANVQKTMALQREILNKATAFQEMWMQVSLTEEQHKRPEDQDAPFHRKVLATQREKILKHKIKRLAKETGLFFAFKESCPYCHEFAPTVKEFAQEYGFEIQAVSGDGGKLKEFPQAIPDNGMLKTLNPHGRIRRQL